MSNPKSYFVTGIGTGIGKTIVSAILTHYFEANYWKPIQSGRNTDSSRIKKLINIRQMVFKEQYIFELPVSPHEASKKENIKIELHQINLNHNQHPILVEGCGGLYTPINETATNIDLIRHLNLPTILVTQDYLGCINHTLLSINALKEKQIEISHLVFNKPFNPETKSIILKNIPPQTKVLEIPKLSVINKGIIVKASEHLKKQ